MTGSDENHVIEQWREAVEDRAAGRKHQVKRGTRPAEVEADQAHEQERGDQR